MTLVHMLQLPNDNHGHHEPGREHVLAMVVAADLQRLATLGGRPMMGKMDIRKAKKRIGVEKAHPQLNPGGMRIRSCHKKQPSRRDASEQASRRAKC